MRAWRVVLPPSQWVNGLQVIENVWKSLSIRHREKEKEKGEKGEKAHKVLQAQSTDKFYRI